MIVKQKAIFTYHQSEKKLTKLDYESWSQLP